MRSYLDLLDHVLTKGKRREDRTGTGTLSVFGHQLRVDLRAGFPALTTKKIHMKSVIHELLWFISGDTMVNHLQENGVTIWDEWATKEQCARLGREPGDLGPIYGHQWRNFGATRDAAGRYRDDGVDQLQRLQREIRDNPHSRRLVISAWHPAEADQVTLPPCHTLFQFYVQDGELSCHLYQRSADVFLGVPFNIASHALLTHMMAHVCGLRVADLVVSYGDLHLYNNHVEQAQLQLNREPRTLPTLALNQDVKSLFGFQYGDVVLIGYEPHPAIPAPVAV